VNQDLWTSICNKDNFYEAWYRVRANLGAPGMDRVSIADFEANLDENLALLLETVQQGSYQPLPYLIFSKKKNSGGSRELKIPAVRDRIVQEAILLRLKPIYEKIFLDCSYAYRPGKSALKAADRVMRNIKKGREWVVDGDIENFFDNVFRQLLFDMLASQIDDTRVLKLIEMSITPADSDTERGIPQGAAISPLLANIYLHPLDETMIRAQWNYVRFSDNLVVLCHSSDEANQALERATGYLEGSLKLSFNPEKTQIIHASTGFIFLGYHFDLHGKRPSTPAIEKMKNKIETVINKAAEISDSELKTKLESIIRGWANYFQMDAADKQKLLAELRQKMDKYAESLPGRILMAALALYLGDKNQARTLIEQTPAQESDDPEIQVQWGIINELADRPGEAVDAYHSAFRLRSDHPEAAYRLGLHYLNQGQFERAIRFLQKAVSINPQSAQFQFALGTALKSYHLYGAAKKAFDRAFQLDPKLRKLKLHSMPPNTVQKDELFSNFSATDIAKFLDIFSAREGVFARQWADNRGRMGYMPVREPITTADIQAHLAGKETLAIYLMRSDNTVNHVIIDIDVSKQVRLEIPTQEQAMDKWQQIAHQDAAAIAGLCQKLGLAAYIENSGFKGRHVWMFFAEPIPARDGIAFAKKLLTNRGEPPTGLIREIFPKEARVSTKALGSLIKLPLGIHKLTNQRCLFLEPNGTPYPNQFDLLHSIQTITRQQFYQAMDKLRSGLTEEQPADLDMKPVDTMIDKCNVLKYLANKAEKQRHLSHVDRLTLLHTLGHLGKAGHYKLHQIIGKTINYDHRITQRWIQRLKGLPVSCPKIREWQSHITPSIGCFCPFPKTSKSYPTPQLHIDPKFEPKRTRAKPITSTSTPKTLTDSQPTTPVEPQPVIKSVEKPGAIQPEPPTEKSRSRSRVDINKLVQNYITIRQRYRKIEKEKQTIENQLQQLFDQHNCDRMELELGVLRRVKQGETVQWIIEI